MGNNKLNPALSDEMGENASRKVLIKSGKMTENGCLKNVLFLLFYFYFHLSLIMRLWNFLFFSVNSLVISLYSDLQTPKSDWVCVFSIQNSRARIVVFYEGFTAYAFKRCDQRFNLNPMSPAVTNRRADIYDWVRKSKTCIKLTRLENDVNNSIKK